MNLFAKASCLAVTAASLCLADSSAITLTLKQAIARARQYSPQLQAARIAQQLAHEDTKQARAAALPTVNGFNQFIYTEGNGTPSGVFVANDGVHVYNEQLQAHEELLALLRGGEVRLAAATEAVARVKSDVASRGLVVTVVQDFYAVISADRKAQNARKGLDEARRFLDISQKLEAHGEAAHADTIKAQLQVGARERELSDAQLSAEKAKIALAVLTFPSLTTDFEVVDDTPDSALPAPLEDASRAAQQNSPDLLAARLGLHQAQLGVTVARYAYLPSLGLDVFYGINANQFAARATEVQDTGRSTLPNYIVPFRQNLGYSAQATLNIPLWNWGATHSKVKQAKLRQEQAQSDLSATEKQVQADLATAYREQEGAFQQLTSLRSSSDLAAESLRLTLLRYKAGEATAFEVSDAQSTASLARAALDDGIVRYRVALATIQNLTGAL